MAAPNATQTAKNLIAQISKSYGDFNEEKLRRVELELCRDAEPVLLRKDQMNGPGTIVFPKTLYATKAGFVFELLQNVNDNHYTKAAALDKSPYVSFRVYPRRIIMECNEDGFSDENVKAICSVRKSSKQNPLRYIGRRGIGFKSVFTVAERAHIQSGPFSFSFNHRNGESIMGMISPVWEEPKDERDSSLTRLTLHLHDNGQSDELGQTQEIVRKQFQELQETILLFFNNLTMIRVSFHRTDGAEESSVTHSIKYTGLNHAVLTRATIENGTEKRRVKHYHVTKHHALGIPRHDNWSCFGAADQLSKIILAFPLSETLAPIIEPQEIFAYHPIRPVGFNFIIHADFVTEANRQDIVNDSLRNVALLDAVADTFVGALMQLSARDSLRFQWIRYLPQRNEDWDEPWLSLVNRIAIRSSQMHVFYCHKNHDRHLITDLVRLPSDFCEDGEPLFEDGDPESIISQRYHTRDLNILMDYGLKYAGFGHFLTWLSADLGRGARSRMRSPETTASWHTQTARLLHEPFLKNWPKFKAQLKTMDLLPLSGGAWVSATASDPVFFARVHGMDIPPNIGLNMINEKVNIAERLTLFRDLGVREAPISLVRKKILEMYMQVKLMPDMSVQTSKQHLTFLYLTDHLKTVNEPSYSSIVLVDRDQCIHNPSSSVMYMATDRNPHSPWELLKAGSTRGLTGSAYDAPGFKDHYFVNDGYFLDPPQTPPNQTLTWAEWFHSQLKISKYVHFGYACLSEAAKYLEKYRPHRFLGALQRHHHYNPHLSLGLIKCVQEAMVLCRGRRKILLKSAYFPTKRLENLANRFLQPGTYFPWIWTESESHDVMPDDMKRLLSGIRVGLPLNDLEFALDLLRYNVRAMKDGFTSTGIANLFGLYQYIQTLCQVGKGTSEAQAERIRKTFKNEEAICIPQFRNTNYDCWVSPEQCVWGAPRPLDTKYALKVYYEALPFLSDENRLYLQKLFSSTLGLSDCTLDIYVDELKSLQRTYLRKIDDVEVLYKEIDKLCRIDIEQGTPLNWLRDQFEEHALVYVASKDGSPWCKPSHCAWSTKSQLGDKVCLNKEYEELHWLFVCVLEFKPMALEMAIDQLNEAGCRQSVSVEEVKTCLLKVNSFLCSGQTAPQSRLNRKSKIFPVRHPGLGVQCVSAQTQFFLVDRESLRSSFADHVKFLDFSLEESIQLRMFLSWAQLDDRYISRSVKEITSISSVQIWDAESISNTVGERLRNRAHAILRIATHFDSPRTRSTTDTEALYEILQKTKIFATDAISREFSLSQDGVSYKALGGSTGVHFHEQGSSLTIYLPRSKVARQHAFHKYFPERLLQWLMTDKDTQIPRETSDKAVIAMKDVWSTSLTLLSTTLDECGIIKIGTPRLCPLFEGPLSVPAHDSASQRETGDCNGIQAAPQNKDGSLENNSKLVDTSHSAPDTPRNGIASTQSGSDPGKSPATLMTQGEQFTLPVRPVRFQFQMKDFPVLRNIIVAGTSSGPRRYEDGIEIINLATALS